MLVDNTEYALCYAKHSLYITYKYVLLIKICFVPQIVEIRPESVSELELGKRICVYWSSQLSYLHPSTVVGPDHDDDYILVQLDDGDSRDVHIEQVRYLPQNYPVVGEENHLLFLLDIFLPSFLLRFGTGSGVRAGVLRRPQGTGLSERY